MTLDQCVSLDRLPTAAEVLGLCDEIGLSIRMKPDGKPVLVNATGSDEAAALAKFLRREPWRSEVLAMVAERQIPSGQPNCAPPAQLPEPEYLPDAEELFGSRPATEIAGLPWYRDNRNRVTGLFRVGEKFLPADQYCEHLAAEVYEVKRVQDPNRRQQLESALAALREMIDGLRSLVPALHGPQEVGMDESEAVGGPDAA